MFKNFKETLENTKQSFLCGICFEDLNNPKKCPHCSFTACEKCFNVINIYNLINYIKEIVFIII